MKSKKELEGYVRGLKREHARADPDVQRKLAISITETYGELLEQSKIPHEQTFYKQNLQTWAAKAHVQLPAEYVDQKRFKVSASHSRDLENDEITGPASYSLSKIKIDYSHISGLEDVRDKFDDGATNPFLPEYKDIYARDNKKPGGAILLYGPPGCGKTFLVRAGIGQLKKRLKASLNYDDEKLEDLVTFYNIKASSWLSKWHGETAKLIEQTFDNARKKAGCDGISILFVDEIDSLFGSKMDTDVGTERIATLLQKLDGFEERGNILLIGATNRPWAIDSRFIGPGERLGEPLMIGPPNQKVRAKLFERYSRQSTKLDYNLLATITDGFSPRGIKGICEYAATINRISAVAKVDGRTDKEIKYDTKLFREVIEKSSPSVTDWLMTAEVSGTFKDPRLKKYSTELSKLVEQYIGSEQRPYQTPILIENNNYGYVLIEKDVDNPFKLNEDMIEAARKITDGLTTPLERGEALFNYIEANVDYDDAYREEVIKNSQSRPARDATEVWLTGEGVCGELASLYIAMARSVGLKSGYVKVDVDHKGHKVNHACAYLERNGLRKLVDPAYHTFGIKHEGATALSDSEAIDHFMALRQRFKS